MAGTKLQADIRTSNLFGFRRRKSDLRAIQRAVCVADQLESRMLLAGAAAGFGKGDRVEALGNSGIIVRSAPPQLSRLGSTNYLYDQIHGTHGTIVGGPLTGTAGGFTGNWWQIDWDAGIDGWSAESVLAAAPLAGDVAKPSLLSPYYASNTNIFWKNGFAPASTSPPNPQLGSALGNCTWYAWGRLAEQGYNLTQLSALHGNAYEWDTEAQVAGVPVDSTPTVGSIAQTDSDNPDNPNVSGHVAVVESVNSDGTITVTESSYVTDSSSPWNILWRHRTTSPSWFKDFIHVSKAGPSYTYSLTRGLNLVSFPFTPNANGSSKFSDIFASLGADFLPYAISLNSKGIFDITPADSFSATAKTGYFIFMNNPRTITVSGNPANTGLTVNRGWNLVGVTNHVVPPNNADVFPSAFQYTNPQFAIIPLFQNGLDPGIGYYVYGYRDGITLLPSGTPGRESGTESPQSGPVMPAGNTVGDDFAATLTVSQPNATSEILQFGMKPGATDGFDFPPDELLDLPSPGSLALNQAYSPRPPGNFV
jgi:surface antigen